MLSGLEEQAMALSAELANVLRRIVYSGGGVQAATDWQELAHHVHVIQRYVLSNSTAREYPDRFRILGQLLQEPAPAPVEVDPTFRDSMI